ncbi:diacylglycerol kinase theta-like isoform X2 [Paramacrobiotus metropolitanus]|uniref:diacylglycerol kinase theta-like isoform X2 n=1 Tax=Paramacrobiotus metropolitanus TaxID=2943436 RepID=UPI002446568E|nr:diacylglycerol kinase theta-like isoform X2 [Paramacrobiotus metropolitanus]
MRRSRSMAGPEIASIPESLDVDRRTSADSEGAESSSATGNTDQLGHGHFFTKKSFHKPSYCHHCAEMIWTLIGVSGYVCEVCNFVVHERCMKHVVTPCSSIAAALIKNPVPHCWSELIHVKRKFCNVCRKRLDDLWCFRCEICDYYVHAECQEFAASNCRECATYTPGKEPAQIIQYHHWSEGNLPNNSKCASCRKSCWSSECLCGYRCAWCILTAHPLCRSTVPQECDFGPLKKIMLPPSVVTIPRTELPMETIIGVLSYRKMKDKESKEKESGNEKETRTAISEELSSSTGINGKDSSGESSSSKERKRRKEKEREDKEERKERDSQKEERRSKDKDDEEQDSDAEIVKVFDGNSSMRRKVFRTITVNRNAGAKEVVEAALRSFYIKDDPGNYYITEALEGSEERTLDVTTPICSMLMKEDSRERPSLFLRYRDKDPNKGFIKVYPGNLKSSQGYKSIPVTSDTTVDDVLEYALRKFGLGTTTKSKYNLIEVTMDNRVTERVLSHNEKPWRIMQQIRKESIHQMLKTRFYLQEKEDPHGSTIALFIGNLPSNLSQRQYHGILMGFIGDDNPFSTIGIIYYEYGSVVIIYDNNDAAVRAFNSLKVAVFDDRNLLVMLLPNIQAQLLANLKELTPLLVFVNVKSGGCQGMELIASFRKLLNPYQVFDLGNGGPLPGLYVFRNVPKYRILICGGDGTVGWVLQCLDNVGQDSVCQSPPCAVVPLGTGNDLARVLRWGTGYTGDEEPMDILRDVIEADEIRLDRWTVVFHPDEKPEGEVKAVAACQVMSSSTAEDNTSMFVMNNYFGIGLDADLALDFHNAREENPDKFNSRFHNKRIYFKMGLRKMVKNRSAKSGSRDLQKEIELEVDGKHVDLPPVEGIIILNILSWGAGCNPWGMEKDETFSKPTHWDGMLEVVGVTGVVHLGQMQSGLRSGIRIAQGGHIRIKMRSELPVHVDGEPWSQGSGQVVVLRSALRATMLKKTKIKRRHTTEVHHSVTEPERSSS